MNFLQALSNMTFMGWVVLIAIVLSGVMIVGTFVLQIYLRREYSQEISDSEPTDDQFDGFDNPWANPSASAMVSSFEFGGTEDD